VKRLLLVLAACGGSAPAPVAPQKPAPPPASETTWDQLHGPIKTVAVNPNNAKVADVFKPEIGKPLDRDHLREVLDTALREPGVAELVLRGRQVADGIELLVDVSPQPIVHGVTAHDPKGQNVSLGNAFTLTPNWSLDPRELDKVVTQIVEDLRAHGFYFARAAWTKKPSAAASGQVDVDIVVAQGPSVSVGSVDIAGVKGGKKDELLAIVNKSLKVGDPWVDERLERILLEVTEYYLDRGYLNATIDPPTRPPVAGGTIPLALTIHEGDRFTLGTLKFGGGVSAADAKTYSKLANLKVGNVFNRHEVIDAMKRITDSFTKAGKPEPEVTPETEIDVKKKTVTLTLDVKPK